MKKWPLAVLLGLAACAAPKTKVEYAENMDLAGYRRIAVLPFTDVKGRGRQISQAIARGLHARGFEAVDPTAVEGVFAKFKPDKEFGYEMSALTEIKEITKAQAMLSGSVDPSGKQASALLLDVEQGEEIFKATLLPAHPGAFTSGSEIADQALSLFAELPKREK